MSDPNEIGAKPNGNTFPASFAAPKFDPAAVSAFWQSSAARLMRSSEIFMHGMAEVARLEAEIGQQLLQRVMGNLKAPATDAKPEERAQEQLNQAMQACESLITRLRNMANKSWHVCNDATMALFETGYRSEALPPALHMNEPILQGKTVPSVATSGAVTPSAANAAE